MFFYPDKLFYDKSSNNLFGKITKSFFNERVYSSARVIQDGDIPTQSEPFSSNPSPFSARFGEIFSEEFGEEFQR